MARLSFAGADLVPLIEHARHSKDHSMPYGHGRKEPGLLLVKDDGIYLMSNGRPGQSAEKDATTKLRVAYAKGYEALSGTPAQRSAQYDKIRAAVGGDDFVEFLGLSSVGGIKPGDTLVVTLNSDSMRLDVQRPGVPAGGVSATAAQ